MEKINYAEMNREAWNQVALIHQKASKEWLIENIQKDDFSTLDEVEREVFRKICVNGKKVAQLCCNNGRELISVIKSGADYGVGFDICDEVIKEAKELSTFSSANCDFERVNILEINKKYDEFFDVVYITVGALTWFENMEEFFKVVSRILKKDGNVFIYEMHPIIQIMAVKDEEAYDEDNELKIVYSYFKNDPWIENTSLDYIGNSEYEQKTTCSFLHNISQIINSMIKNGLKISEFNEYAHDKSATFKHLEKYNKLPMSFSIIAQK